MARTVRQIDAWINDHIAGHVLSGHTHPTHEHPFAATTHIHAATTPVPTPIPVPPGPEPPSTSVRREVSTSAALRAAVDDATVDEVIVAPGRYNIGYFLPPLPRPASKPLLVRARDFPVNPADPHSVILTGNLYFRNRSGSYTTWQGFSFEDTSVGSTGIVVFGAYGEPGPDHVTWLDTRFVNNIPLNAHNSHHWYLSSGASSDILIDRYYVEGVSHSAFSGFHGYHDPLGTRVTVKHGVIRNVYAGLLAYGDLSAFLAEDIDISNCRMAADLRGIAGTLRRVNATNIEPGYGMIQGPITLDNCSGLPVVQP